MSILILEDDSVLNTLYDIGGLGFHRLGSQLRHAAGAAQIQAWADAHGSERLRAGLRRGHDMCRTMADELIQWAYGSAGTWIREYSEEPRNDPSAGALALLDKVEALGTHPWLTILPQIQRADITPKRDERAYLTGIVVDVALPDESGNAYGFLLRTE